MEAAQSGQEIGMEGGNRIAAQRYQKRAGGGNQGFDGDG